MTINREEARMWSEARIREEIADLRREISESYDEIRDLEDEMDQIQEEDRESGDPWRDHEKSLDAKSDAISAIYNVITQAEKDIKFLKSILDGTDTEELEDASDFHQQASGKRFRAEVRVEPASKGRTRGRSGVSGYRGLGLDKEYSSPTQEAHTIGRWLALITPIVLFLIILLAMILKEMR